MKTLRARVTFEFDEAKITDAAIRNRLDAILDAAFADIKDWNTRWTEDLSAMPLYGAASADNAEDQE